LNTIYKNLYFAIIGKLFTIRDLGFYSRAFRLQEITSQNMTAVVSGVAFPVFAIVQNDKIRLARGVRTALEMLAFIVFPMMLILYAVSEQIVVFLLTDKWLPCVPYFKLLCAVGALYPFFVLYSKVLLAIGESGLLLKVHIFQKLLAIFLIGATIQHGIPGLITGQIFSMLVSTLLISYIVGRLIDYRLTYQLATVFPYIAIVAVIVPLLFLLNYHSFPNTKFSFIFLIMFGTVVYLIVCFKLKLSAFRLLTGLVYKKFTSLHFLRTISR
jgi:O-antigen/teichoic acid export membrane protein